jgi:hypothetical protein
MHARWRNIAVLFTAFAATVAVFADDPSPAEFAIRVPAPGPGVLADDVLQKAIDTAAARGGGVVELGVGDFKLSRHAGDETIVLESGVTLRGQGYGTHIYLDPATPPNPLRYYPVRIGTETTPASNVVVENLRYTGNNAKIGGGSIMGFNARLGDPAVLLSCDNITIRHCWIYDAQQAAGCTKPGGPHYTEPARLAAQFKNWRVCGNTIDTCGNKAIEFDECNGGLIADNYIDNTRDGPQVICGSRNVEFRDNEVYFTDTGINITEGSNHIRVVGNHVEPVATIHKSTANACLLFRTEPVAHVSEISDVVVTGNIFRDQTTTQKGTLKFTTRPQSEGCLYRSISITGNIFDGNVLLLDGWNPAKTTIKDVLFADNICEGDLLSQPSKTVKTADIVIRGCMLRKAGAYVVNADRWIWSGNTIPNGTLSIAAGADSNVIRDNVVATPVNDLGTGTQLSGNIVRPPTSSSP